MVRDAEAHSEEDKKFEEMVGLSNQADGLIHGARKAVADAGDKASEEEKESIESAATELEEALKSENKEEIEAKIAILSEASAGLAQKMYAEQAEAAGQEAGAGSQEDGSDGDAVEAEFEEVKEEDKKE